jgi:DNA polymerase III alpha subunit
VPISLEQLILLIRVGAFRFSQNSKANLLWEAQLRRPRFNKKNSPVLFDTNPKDIELPDFPQNALEDMYDEMEIMGFPLRPPFAFLGKVPEGSLQGGFGPEHLGKTVQVLGYLVTRKMVRTVNGKLMQFANFLDPVATWIDVTIFPPETEQYPLSGRAIYNITGKVVQEFGVYSMEATKVQRLPLQADPRHDASILEPQNSIPRSADQNARGSRVKYQDLCQVRANNFESSMSKQHILHLNIPDLPVSVERLHDKRLHNKPLVVGGFSGRSLVDSCSAEARACGIRPGQKLKMA